MTEGRLFQFHFEFPWKRVFMETISTFVGDVIRALSCRSSTILFLFLGFLFLFHMVSGFRGEGLTRCTTVVGCHDYAQIYPGSFLIQSIWRARTSLPTSLGRVMALAINPVSNPLISASAA